MYTAYLQCIFTRKKNKIKQRQSVKTTINKLPTRQQLTHLLNVTKHAHAWRYHVTSFQSKNVTSLLAYLLTVDCWFRRHVLLQKLWPFKTVQSVAGRIQGVLPSPPPFLPLAPASDSRHKTWRQWQGWGWPGRKNPWIWRWWRRWCELNRLPSAPACQSTHSIRFQLLSLS